MMSSSLSRWSVTFSVFVVSLIVLAPSSFANEQAAAPNKKKCTKEHKEIQHPCMPNNPDPKKATVWSKMTDGAYKTCEKSSNPKDNCVEKLKVTSEIELFDNDTCTPPRINKYGMSNLRCD
jgi:hypothetical protein